MLKNGKEEWRLSSRCGGYVVGRSKNNINRRKAISGKLTGAPLLKNWIAVEVGDDEEIDVTTRPVRAFGVRAEENDALRREGAHITCNDTT